MRAFKNSNKGSIELITIGLVIALLLLLAMPVLIDLSDSTDDNIGDLCSKFVSTTDNALAEHALGGPVQQMNFFANSCSGKVMGKPIY